MGLPQRIDDETGSVGAPSQLADEAEVPQWFAEIVAYFSALPLLVSFIIGLIGFSTIACCLFGILFTIL
ncbi:MAG: hypothetical protein DPW16_12480 [Chloroflexi bacterium]|nr:hypothetical protein [Chloroflexota bacterium]